MISLMEEVLGCFYKTEPLIRTIDAIKKKKKHMLYIWHLMERF